MAAGVPGPGTRRSDVEIDVLQVQNIGRIRGRVTACQYVPGAQSEFEQLVRVRVADFTARILVDDQRLARRLRCRHAGGNERVRREQARVNRRLARPMVLVVSQREGRVRFVIIAIVSPHIVAIPPIDVLVRRYGAGIIHLWCIKRNCENDALSGLNAGRRIDVKSISQKAWIGMGRLVVRWNLEDRLQPYIPRIVMPRRKRGEDRVVGIIVEYLDDHVRRRRTLGHAIYGLSVRHSHAAEAEAEHDQALYRGFHGTHSGIGVNCRFDGIEFAVVGIASLRREKRRATRKPGP